MALTKTQLREILSKAGVSAENAEIAINSIMDGHLASVNALREERDKFKEDAEKLPSVQKELNEFKSSGDDSYKAKYEKEHEDFENYKAQQTAKETKANKVAAYRALLKETGVSEKRIDTIIRASSPEIDAIELDKDGKIKDSDSAVKSIKENWSDFIVAQKQQGANTPNPPHNEKGGTKWTKEDIMKITDTTQRQKAWCEFIEQERNS